jgi:5-methylthioadenosine/S-adenosylhomocysteine deaminase
LDHAANYRLNKLEFASNMASAPAILVKGGHLFDIGRPVETGDILIQDGRIARIGPDLDPEGARIFDARGKIVMPGFVNAHTHSNQALEKGLCDKYPLDAWMVIASYGGQNAELSPRELYVSAAIGAIEMIRTGSTAVLDMPRMPLGAFDASADAVMQAYADVGMRAGVAASFTDLNFAASLPLELVPGMSDQLKPAAMASVQQITDCLERFVQRWKDRHPRLQPMIGPSSLPRCSTELFESSVDLARRHGVGLQTHLLSGKAQVMVGHKRYGGSTAKFLQRIGALSDGMSFAHSIWLDDEEVKIMAQSPAVIVHNPVSNMKLGAGRAPIPLLKRAGARIALGSDGASSADSQNMFETIKGAAIAHRPSHEQEDWIQAGEALEMCWRGGGAALRQPIGRLEPGHCADLTLLHSRNLFVAPWEQLAGQIVHSELGGSVDSVIIGGDLVLDNGRFVSINEAELHREAQEIVKRLYAGLPERMARFEAVRALFRELERKVHRQALHFTRYCQ